MRETTLKPGSPVTIVEGPFSGLPAVLVRETGTKVVLEVTVFGRNTEVTLERREVLMGAPLLDELEAEVVSAVRQREYPQRSFSFWRRELRGRAEDPTEEELPAIVRRADAFEAELLRALELETAAEVARFREAFAGLDETARTTKWMKERASWVEWREQARAVRAALDAELPEPEFGTPEFEVLHERQVELRARVEAFRRREVFERPLVDEPRSEALEAAIDAEVDRDDAFLVYGDWLSSRGSARGELISLHAAGRRAPQLETSLLGPLAAFVERLDAQWRLGFLTQVRLEATRDDERDGLDLSQFVAKLWALPSARFLRELRVACASAHEDGVMEKVLATLTSSGPRPSMRALTFETNTEEEMLSWTSTGDLSALGAAFPKLERLFVHVGQALLTAPSFPNLRSLDLRTTSLSSELVSALARASWPQLRHLGLWFGSRSYGVQVSVDDVRPLLDAPLPALTSLGLANSELSDELCTGLCAHPLLARLEVLDLSMGTMTDAGAQTLLVHRERLEHLKRLDVDDNYLSAEAVASLRSAFPQLVSKEQRVAEEYEGALHRYASVGE
ncbi:MAG: hypothetical protein GQE15_34990 [Archangiaceae bacterium]|nr:hypothetical protein [Archangiaceae bacterium]